MNQNYNTYVGARYIPLFDGDWDSTKKYEPLTIVSFEGNSYTSKTYVPAGVPVSNETYWALTGNYNAQVEAYREEVSSLADNVSGLSNDVASLNSIFHARQTIKNRKFILVGDSYGNSEPGNWSAFLRNALGDSVIGSLIINGSGFTVPTTSKKWLQILMDFTATLTEKERNSITDFVVLGGANDEVTDVSTVTNAVVEYNNYVYNNFPNALVSMGFIGNQIKSPNYYYIYNIAMNGWMEGCGKSKNARFINNMQYIMHDHRNFIADGLHPTGAAGTIIGSMAYNALLGGDVNYNTYVRGVFSELFEANISPETKISNVSGGGNIFTQINNGVTTLSYGGWISILFSEEVTLSDGFTVFAKAKNKIYGGQGLQRNAVACRHKTTTGEWVNDTAFLSLAFGNLNLYFPFTPDSPQTTNILLYPSLETMCTIML